MKAILVRIGIDMSCGEWNAPVDPRTRRFVYVPIPDGHKKKYTPGNARSYQEVTAPLLNFARSCGTSGLRCPDALMQRRMHLDPDFEHLTYGDNGLRRGARIAQLAADDLLVFYAALRSIDGPRALTGC